MKLSELKIKITVKGHIRSMSDTFRIVNHPCILEKIAIDFSAKKVRGTCLIEYQGCKNGKWIPDKVKKDVDWFDFDNPNIEVTYE